MALKPFTQEQLTAIAEKLNPKIKPCSACGYEKTWNISPHGSVVIPLATDFFNSAIPAVALTCSNCGNIQLHNIFTLGLAEILGVPMYSKEELEKRKELPDAKEVK